MNLTPTSTPIAVTYAPPQVPVISTNAHVVRAIRGRPFSFTFEATGDPTRFTVGGLGGTNLTFDETLGKLSGTPNANGIFEVIVAAENSEGSSVPFRLTLVVSDARKLIVQADASRGSVAVSPKRAGNIFPEGDRVTLTALPDRPDFFFGNWEFSGAVPDSLTNPTTHFVMGKEDIVLATANFVPNPFLARNGNYTGLLTNATIPAGRVPPIQAFTLSEGPFGLSSSARSAAPRPSTSAAAAANFTIRMFVSVMSAPVSMHVRASLPRIPDVTHRKARPRPSTGRCRPRQP